MNIIQELARLLWSSGLGKMLQEFFDSGKSVGGPVRRQNVYVMVAVIAVVMILSLIESIGRRQQRDRTIEECWTGKSRIGAALLALIFGSLGIHRFYLRYNLTGILQVIGTVLFVSGAWQLGNSTFWQFVAIDDVVAMGLILFLVGAVSQLWHIGDFFMILFGGMIPKRDRSGRRPGHKSAD